MFPYNPPQLPTNNRLTQPIGTPLPNPFQAPFSNPSAALYGTTGANSGALNVPQIGTPGQFAEGGNVGVSQFGQWLKSIFTPQVGRNIQGGGLPQIPNVTTPGRNVQGGGNMSLATNPGRNVEGGVRNVPYGPPAPTGALSIPSSVSASPLVGQGIESHPNALSGEAINAMFAGRTQEEIANIMAAKGYTLRVGSAGFQGSQWVLTNPQSPSQGTTNLGNDFYGNGATLQRGERVSVNPGYNVVGGDVSPGGTGNQYAVTVGTVNQARDKRGDYKWTSYTTKDSNGNWVKVYRKVLRGGVTKQGKRQNAGSNLGQNNNQAAPQANPEPVATNQLVTLRANFG